MRLVCWCMVHGLCFSFPLPHAFILVESEQAANLESLHQGIGLYCFIRWSTGARHIPASVHTKLPLTSISLRCHLQCLPGAFCYLAPVLVEDALREPPADYEVLETTKGIFVGGAALNRVTGKRLIEMAGFNRTIIRIVSWQGRTGCPGS